MQPHIDLYAMNIWAVMLYTCLSRYFATHAENSSKLVDFFATLIYQTLFKIIPYCALPSCSKNQKRFLSKCLLQKRHVGLSVALSV